MNELIIINQAGQIHKHEYRNQTGGVDHPPTRVVDHLRGGQAYTARGQGRLLVPVRPQPGETRHLDLTRRPDVEFQEQVRGEVQVQMRDAVLEDTLEEGLSGDMVRVGGSCLMGDIF